MKPQWIQAKCKKDIIIREEDASLPDFLATNLKIILYLDLEPGPSQTRGKCTKVQGHSYKKATLFGVGWKNTAFISPC